MPVGASMVLELCVSKARVSGNIPLRIVRCGREKGASTACASQILDNYSPREIPSALNGPRNVASADPGQFRGFGVPRQRTFTVPKMRKTFLLPKACDVDAVAAEVDGKFMSAFARAVKPGTGHPGSSN